MNAYIIVQKVSVISLAVGIVFSLPLATNLYLVIFIVVTAALMDIKAGRIPNVLTLPAIVAGLCYYGYYEGWRGYLFSLAGLGIGMGLLIPFYRMKAMGAGDVKLMGAVGSLLGAALAFKALLAVSIMGGLLSILTLVNHGCLGRTIERYWLMAKCLLLSKEISYVSPEEEIRRVRLPYGVAIALGTMIVIWIDQGL